ncbi:hypothetical protein [Lacticaseibacillus saniviri]
MMTFLKKHQLLITFVVIVAYNLLPNRPSFSLTTSLFVAVAAIVAQAIQINRMEPKKRER